METASSELITTRDLTRILDLADTRELEREIGNRPNIFRWFVNAKVCQHLVHKNSHDVNLQHAWSQPLEIVNRPGHVIVAAAVTGAERWRHASSAFMFPLQWTRSVHAVNIPNSLLDIAGQVVDRVRASPRLIEEVQTAESRFKLQGDWGLAWSFADWQNLDLFDLGLSPESAWAPLTIGLVSAILNRRLSQDLLATGYWDEAKNGWTVGPQTLASKLSVGYEGGKRLFVVPASVAQDARATFRISDQRDAKVVELNDDPHDIYAGVLPGLLQAGTEPSFREPPQLQVDWYLSRPTNKDADDYYYQVLLPAIANVRRQELKGVGLSHWRPEYLLSIVSNSEVLIPLTTLIFRPRNLQLIYTHDSLQSFGMGKRFDKIADWLAKIQQSDSSMKDIDLQPPLKINDELESLPLLVDCVERIPRKAGKNSVLIDSTPGKRAMQLAMLQGAQKDDRLLCWWHNTHSANRRPIPFSEKMLLWEVEEGSILRSLTLSTSNGVES